MKNEKMMIQSGLEAKLASGNLTFSSAELEWMLVNIGHPNPELRDELIYSLFRRGLLTGKFTAAQFEWLSEHLVNESLIFHELEADFPEVLTRSFSVLLGALILETDGAKGSKYEGMLTDAQRDYFFEQALFYLEKEHIFQGYSKTYGWVHCFAHGADFLEKIIQHPKSSEADVARVLSVLKNVFKRLDSPFIEGEERRLALPICTGLKNGKISQEQLAEWLSSFDWTVQSHREVYQLATFEVFLAAVYFTALVDQKMRPELEIEMMKILKNICQ